MMLARLAQNSRAAVGRNLKNKRSFQQRLLSTEKAAATEAAAEAPPQASGGGGGGSGAILAVLAAAAGAGGYYYYQEQNKVDVPAVKAAIADILDEEDHDDGSLGPILVRLAWHNAGTFDKNTGKGGSSGAAMRFKPESDWGANAGLGLARSRLEPIKEKFPNISYSDLWSLAGNVAIEEMGGPDLPFRLGRKDKAADAEALPDGLLPDADGRDKKDKPADHLRDIFYRQGFNDREIVALSGAHALGRCHETSSGFVNPWTFAPTTFSNEYFRLLLSEKWVVKKTHKGKKWTGPEQYEDQKTQELMMLPTDMCLIWDEKMKPIVEEYAKDEELFFKDFAAAWTKLQENGVQF